VAHFILRRLLLLVLVLLGVSIAVFALIRSIPGDPVRIMIGEEFYSEQAAEELRAAFGLDQPLPVQYGRWLGRLLSGDFGDSLFLRVPASQLILERGPTTLLLAAVTLAIAVTIAVPVGVMAAVRQNTLFDGVARISSVIFLSMPNFWLGLLFILVFSVELRWFPAGGGIREHGLKALVLPSAALGLSFVALISRTTRASMLEVLRQDYIVTARAKGLKDRVVNYRHALKNALLPVVTVIGLQVGLLLSGAVITETIFSLPGLGSLLVNSVQTRDYPVVQAVVLVVSMIFVIVNFAVDLLYGLLDPRIRYS